METTPYKPYSIALETVKHLGGCHRLAMMIGAHTFVRSGPNDETLTFKFKGNRKMNFCEITLNSFDLYNVKFCRVVNRRDSAPKVTEVKEVIGVYNDMLKEIFESTTGLYLSL